MTEELKNILSKIDELERIKYDSQKDIRNYCTDKSLDLEERWNIWEKYSSKLEEDYIIESGEFKHSLLKYICQKLNDKYNDRGREINYFDFIDEVYYFDSENYEKIPELIRDIKLNSVLSDTNYEKLSITTINNFLRCVLKEAIIEENFGSYRFDW
jgi:hypothetical protein